METYPATIDFTLERVFFRQALAGRDDAFVLLGSMYSEQVYAIARNLCSTDDEALELTRNAFQRAREELSWLPARQSFRTFVCRFLVSCDSRLRRRLPRSSDFFPDSRMASWCHR
jgi:DNA-directed RNA polymerase specialized sigma24 family protein